jgi:hypothetical protein
MMGLNLTSMEKGREKNTTFEFFPAMLKHFLNVDLEA